KTASGEFLTSPPHKRCRGTIRRARCCRSRILLRQILKLQRGSIQLRFEPFHLRQIFRFHGRQSAWTQRLRRGIFFFVRFLFLSCLIQCVDQQRGIFGGFRLALGRVPELVHCFSKFVRAQVDETQIHRIVVFLGVQFRGAAHYCNAVCRFSLPRPRQSKIV